MMKKVVFTLLLLILLSPVFARTLQGRITCEDRGVPGVLVTDGTTFTQSDSKGFYKLDAAENAPFVHIIQPSGYQVKHSDGACRFYSPVTPDKKKYDFELDKLADNRNFVLLAIADVQTGSDKHFAKFQKESIPDLKATIAGYPAGTPIFGISLGDIVWDQFDHFPRYKQEIESLGIPFFSVIGNHDHDKDTKTKPQAEDRFKEEFGPTYYAFCMGNYWCIVLDNIDYEGNKIYIDRVSPEQLSWLKGLLDFIPADAPLIMGVHAPIFSRNEGKGTINRQEILDMLKGHKVDILSGHAHLNVNFEHGDVYEHNLAALCGSWWMPVPGKDGTPKGYGIFEGKGKNLSWQYKSTGKDTDYQMKLYPRGSFDQAVNAVVAHIWNYDSAWKIEWSEDGRDMGAMKRFTARDPEYIKYAIKHKVGNYKHPVSADNYFAAIPSPTANRVIVSATDRFGRTYRDTIRLKNTDIQAHRGGMGLMPENTIPGMINAVKLGVNTLELDLMISKDKQVVVSHDPWMNSKFVSNPNGTPITEKDTKKLALYDMTYAEISRYETGLKVYDAFPLQQKIKTRKPLLAELIDSVEHYTQSNNLAPVYYNIEIKSSEKNDNVYSPVYTEFADLAIEVLTQKGIAGRTIVQCFDIRTLKYLHEKYPHLQLAYLVGKEQDNFEANISALGFVPAVYSPHHSLVSKQLMENVRRQGMKIIPWTVDQPEDIQKMIDLKVDGIISNYPDRILPLTRKYYKQEENTLFEN